MGNEAILYITEFVPVLLVLIPLGAAFIIASESFKKVTSDDEHSKAQSNKRIKNTLVASIIGMSITGFITFIQGYFI